MDRIVGGGFLVLIGAWFVGTTLWNMHQDPPPGLTVADVDGPPIVIAVFGLGGVVMIAAGLRLILRRR